MTMYIYIYEFIEQYIIEIYVLKLKSLQQCDIRSCLKIGLHLAQYVRDNFNSIFNNFIFGFTRHDRISKVDIHTSNMLSSSAAKKKASARTYFRLLSYT